MSHAIKLSELVDAMKSYHPERRYYVHVLTGAVHAITAEEFRAAEANLAPAKLPAGLRARIAVATEVLHTQNFLPLPERAEIDEYRMMEGFCLSLTEPALREAMTYAIQGAGAFRRFKERLQHYGLVEQWFEFREARYCEVAAQWCEAHGLAYVKDERVAIARGEAAAPSLAPTPQPQRSANTQRMLEDLTRMLPQLGMIELLAALVQAPSHPGIARQEEQAVQVLAQYFDRQRIPYETNEVREGRPNLVARCAAPMPGKRLVLCGHTDTVPPNAITTMAPFAAEVRDGRMYGRGTVDMKGALAAMAATLVALREMQLLSRGEVILAAVIDEEMESLGAEALLRAGLQAEGAIIGEPTHNRIAIGHKGLEWLEVEFIGKATHGGTLEQGCNAISAAARFMHAVEKELLPRFHRRRHPLIGAPTINFGTIRGGDQPSTVAARCVLQLDRRWVPEERVELVFAELEDVLNHVRHAMPGLRTELRRVPGGMATMVHGPLEIAREHPLVRAAQLAGQELYQKNVELTAFPAWTDAALFSREGKIPSVVCGPGDLALAHSAEESIALAEVEDAARLYALMAVNFLAEH